jgi:hypothetical protein
MEASEEAFGKKTLGAEFTVWTKASNGLGSGAGKRNNILEQGGKSNEFLRLNKVSLMMAYLQNHCVLTICKIPVYFLYAPDESVPVAETLDAIQTLYKEERFEKVCVTPPSSAYS